MIPWQHFFGANRFCSTLYRFGITLKTKTGNRMITGYIENLKVKGVLKGA